MKSFRVYSDSLTLNGTGTFIDDWMYKTDTFNILLSFTVRRKCKQVKCTFRQKPFLLSRPKNCKYTDCPYNQKLCCYRMGSKEMRLREVKRCGGKPSEHNRWSILPWVLMVSTRKGVPETPEEDIDTHVRIP